MNVQLRNLKCLLLSSSQCSGRLASLREAGGENSPPPVLGATSVLWHVVLSVAMWGDTLLGSGDQKETSLRHHIGSFCMALAERLGVIRRENVVAHGHRSLSHHGGDPVAQSSCSRQQSGRQRLCRPLQFRTQTDCSRNRESGALLREVTIFC